MPTENEVEQVSPFQRLNSRLDGQNETFYGLVNRLSNKLHQLNDTNVPTAILSDAKKEAQLPFNEGYLMQYNNKLAAYNNLISELRVIVEKVESLL